MLVPLTVVWTNLHGGFLALIAVLGLAAVGTAVEAWIAQEAWGGRDGAAQCAMRGLAAACAAASLVNPYGYELHVHVVAVSALGLDPDASSRSSSRPASATRTCSSSRRCCWSGLIAAGLAVAPQARSWKALWIVFFAHMALASVRHVPVFVTVTAPVIASEIAGWWKAWTAGAAKKSLAGIVNQMAADSASGFRRTSVWPAAVVVGSDRRPARRSRGPRISRT